MDEMLYFSWESGPAVVTPEVDNSVFGFFISPEASEWEMATPLQISDFFIDGSRLEKTEFENMFGVIGTNLPDLPATT